jgi:hypothetical protein
MKNLIKILTILTFFFLISCKENIENVQSIASYDKEITLQQTEELTIYKVSNQVLSNELSKYFLNSSVSLKSIGISLGVNDMNLLNFDFENSSKTKIKGIEGEFLLLIISQNL